MEQLFGMTFLMLPVLCSWITRAPLVLFFMPLFVLTSVFSLDMPVSWSGYLLCRRRLCVTLGFYLTTRGTFYSLQILAYLLIVISTTSFSSACARSLLLIARSG